MEWKALHQHYRTIMKEHQLYVCDVVRQLGGQSSSTYVRYLSEDGYLRSPANKVGTTGRGVRDLLNSGLHKIDWQPSTASYEDKLYELPIDHMYMHFRLLDVYEAPGVNTPHLSVSLCMDEGYMMTKEALAIFFTIDGVVPIIDEVNKLYQLVLREPSYIPLGDR